VKEGQPLDYDQWVYGVRDGRNYVGDGLSHLFDFTVGGLGVGEKGEAGGPSVLAAKAGQPLKVTVKAAALLEESPRNDIRSKALDKPYYWHVERARVGDTRKVPVELIVNGKPAGRREVEADGSIHDLTFDYTPTQSSWVALRILPSSHTNPVFVEVDGKPVRASRKSAPRRPPPVDVCWNAKKGNIRPEEREAAAKAYDVARESYRRILSEANAD
jgi:hypothetical protein